MKPENKQSENINPQDEHAKDISHDEEQASWLEESQVKIDSEFPLSGGETEEDLRDDSDGDDNDFIAGEHLDDKFPLSGG